MHLLRHIIIIICGCSVTGRIRDIKIAPTLKCSTGSWLDPNQAGIKDKTATRSPVEVAQCINSENLLTHLNPPPNDPIQRTAIDDFVGAARRVARNMDVQRLSALRLQAFAPPGLYIFELANRVNPDTKFE